MYRKLTECRGKFVEIGQSLPEGRHWYTGRIVSLDPETLTLEMFDDDGVVASEMIIPLPMVVNVYTKGEELSKLIDTVTAKEDEVKALVRCLALPDANKESCNAR